MTVREAAQERGYKDFDCALPQPWVDQVKFVEHFDVRGHFVWCYDKEKTFGEPAPITKQGDEFKAKSNVIYAVSIDDRET